MTEQAQGIWEGSWTAIQISVNKSNHPQGLRWSFRWLLIV